MIVNYTQRVKDMATTTQSGREGEEYAVQFLKENGFTVLHRNWRHARYEIDVLAQRDEVLHIVEVKYRASNAHGHPEENVNKKKFRYLVLAAEAYLFLNPGYRQVQFDVLAITGRPASRPDYLFIEDVFF